MKLTEEQKKMVENNHNLIYGYCMKKKLNIDDWYGDLAISLCEAVQNYDSNKSKFSTYAYKYFDNKVLYINRENRFEKRKINLLKTEIDTENISEEYNDKVSKKVLKDKYYTLDSEYNCNLIMEKFDNDIGRLAVNGLTQIEIAKKLNISFSKVQKTLNNLRKVIAEEIFD